MNNTHLRAIAVAALLWLCNAFALISGPTPYTSAAWAQGVSPQAKASSTTPRSAPKASPRIDQERERIESFVLTVQSRKGRAYAERVASAIVTSARRNRVCPYLVASTAYVESHFRMVARPGIGMMQIMPSTARRAFGKSGLNPRDLEDNIEMGTRYLASHYYRGRIGRQYATLASRSGSTAYRVDGRMRHASGRYNGAGARSAYVRRIFNTRTRLMNGDPKSWSRTIRSKGALWK